MKLTSTKAIKPLSGSISSAIVKLSSLATNCRAVQGLSPIAQHSHCKMPALDGRVCITTTFLHKVISFFIALVIFCMFLVFEQQHPGHLAALHRCNAALAWKNNPPASHILPVPCNNAMMLVAVGITLRHW